MNEDSLRTLALMNETGYQIQQDNGQRIYGPPPDWVGPPPKDTEVFIGKLPNDIFEYDIVPLLSSVGKIYLLRIMQNFSGLNRGFAFVQYTTKEEANACIQILNNVELRPGEKIGVVKSRNNCRLYIGKLDQTLTKDEIVNELEKYTEDIVEVIIHKSDQPGLNNRGYAFVEYLTHKAAAKARRKLVPCKVKIRGIEITVDWATPIHESGENINVTCSLLIKNIKETLSNLELCRFFSVRNSLKISKIKRLPNHLVIIFFNRSLCETAMRVYNDLRNTREFQLLAEKDKKIEIVYLKNNMDLRSFLFAVDYTPPTFFPAASQQNYSDPAQHPNLINQSQQIHTNNQHQNNLQNHCAKLSTNIHYHDNCKCLCRKITNLSINADKSSLIQPQKNVTKHKNKLMQSSQQTIQNQSLVPMQNNVYYNLSNFQNANYIQNKNLLNDLSDLEESISKSISRKLSNMSANNISILNQNYFNNNGTCQNGSINFSNNQANTFVNLSGPQNLNETTEKVFLKNKFNPSKDNSFNYNNLNSQNTKFNHLNSSILNKNYDRNLNSDNMILNESYNFGIWTNNENNTALDASTNWNKFAARKKDAFTNEICNISEEDICSLKSDQDYLENFNCFNPKNSLNLHQNFFRDLTVEKSLSNYPSIYPSLRSLN